MKLIGSCHICGKPAMETCAICGLVTCKNCMNGQSGICVNCMPLVVDDDFEDGY